MRASEFSPRKLVIFDIDDTLVHTQTKVRVIRNGKVVKELNSHDFTHYKLQPGEEFDFENFRNAQEFFNNSKPIIPMMNQLKQDIATGNKVVMVTARADFDDRELFLDTFRKYGVDMGKVHVYRAGNMTQKVQTEEKKKIIIRNLLDKGNYTKAIMYDDAVPNLTSFVELKDEYANTKFYAWHVSLEGEATEFHRTNEQVQPDLNETVISEDAVMGKIADSGKIIRILKKAHTVPFSDEKNWLLVDVDPAKGNKGLGLKWIPADTRFEWVRPYRDTAEQDVAKEGYGDHPSQRVDPRTGKKYVPPKSPLKPSVADESLNEENILHLRDFNVTISLHAVNQADNRNINIRHIDNILKNISKVKSSIMGLSLGSQFILHNGKGTGLGVRKLDGNKLLLATVYNTPAGFVKGKHSTFKVDTSEITQIPEGSEKFNDEVMRPGFRWSEEINGITYLVRTRWDNMPEVIARVNNREVGRATFIDHKTRTGLESVSTYVSPKWQGHGIAKNMYAVMRMLGANIQPSATQTAMGKDMWAKWKKAGDTKHLTSMNAKMDTQGMAENTATGNKPNNKDKRDLLEK